MPAKESRKTCCCPSKSGPNCPRCGLRLFRNPSGSLPHPQRPVLRNRKRNRRRVSNPAKIVLAEKSRLGEVRFTHNASAENESADKDFNGSLAVQESHHLRFGRVESTQWSVETHSFHL